MVTPLYAASARMVGELASILGRQDDAQHYRKLFEDIRGAYLKKFYDASSGQIGPGTQASQSFALYLGLLPEEQRRPALEFLLDDIHRKHDDHLSTGIFGTKYMLAALSRAGDAGVAYTLVNQKTYPGWGYMLENDATTLWEHWKGSDSTYTHNHPMFGSVSEWFYQWLGGIQPAPDAAGFDRIVIRPQVVGDVKWVRCRYRSVRGDISTKWERDGRRFSLHVEIPPNTTATLHLPCDKLDSVKESAKPASQAEGVRFVREKGGEAVFEVGSGRYAFETQLPNRN